MQDRIRLAWLRGVAGTVAGLAVAGSALPVLAQSEEGSTEATAGDETARILPITVFRGNAGANMGGAGADKIPEWKDVSEGLKQVVSTADGDSFYTLWIDEKNNRVLAELPRGYQSQRHFFAMTVASGELFAGLQGADRYVRWEKFGGRMALIEPQVAVRSGTDASVKTGVERAFTDRVVLDVPIVANGPSGQPVIELNELMVQNAPEFFGSSARGINTRLVKVSKAKAFPSNIELAFEAPTAGGTIKTFHYSVSKIEGTPGFKPREADERVGYFATAYRDLSKTDRDETTTRYINRWNLEKADSDLKLSPPKQPIVFYVEHTVPVRYRRWVRTGAEYWNDAFRQIGIDGAVEIRFQDASTGAHMDKDPEDVRYNFIRWLTNDVGTAIGPSRVNPMTGEILDADVVLTDGWLRAFDYMWNDLIGDLAVEGFAPSTLAWLEQNPEWDPRLRLAGGVRREQMLAERTATKDQRGVARFGGHPAIAAGDEPHLLGQGELDGLSGRVSQVNGLCMAAHGTMMNFALMRTYMEVMGAALETGEIAFDTEGDVLDGIPDAFVGPMLADLVAHEVGHTLGLRHNFKGSSVYTMDEINSDEVAGEKPFATTVMDYIPVNINAKDWGEQQGDWAMSGIGPYDYWAIEYGYTFGDTDEVLKRVAEPELQYATDEDTYGPDPLARRYDFSKDPLDYAQNQMALAEKIRGKILDKFVKDGDSWSRARRGYMISLSQHVQAVNMMAGWVGGAHVYRDKKGDPNGRAPIEPVGAETQRKALQFVIENTFSEEAFGLTPELVRHMSVDKWWDDNSALEDSAFPIHDRVLAVQASALTMLLNPATLGRVYDNERLGDDDVLTMPELMSTITDAAWSELDADPSKGKYSDREPMINSFRRNLQREHVDRMVSLSTAGSGYVAATKPVGNLAMMTLVDLQGKIENALEKGEDRVDAYTRAHLQDCLRRIESALDAETTYRG